MVRDRRGLFDLDLATPSGSGHPSLVGAWMQTNQTAAETASNRPYRVDDLVRRLPKTAWVRGTVKEGSKGPIRCDFAFVRVTEARQGLPLPRVWVVRQRNLANPSVVTYAFSNAPETIDTLELVRLRGMRWPVELTFEESKTELGMDQYETRSWLGWHHHMALVMLVHQFLVRVRWSERAPALTLAQVRLLLTSVIALPVWNAERALLRVRYYQQRNHAAYLSHRKRRLVQLLAFDPAS